MRLTWTSVPSMVLTIINFIVVLCVAVGAVSAIVKDILFTILVVIACLGLLAMFILHARGQLTTEELRVCHKSVFTRRGVFVLGGGGFLYQTLMVYDVSFLFSACFEDRATSVCLVAPIMTGLQVYFLVKFQRIKINKSSYVVIFSRLALLHMVAINMSFWFCISVQESVYEMQMATWYSEVKNGTASDHVYSGHDTASDHVYSGNTTSEHLYSGTTPSYEDTTTVPRSGADGFDCDTRTPLSSLLAPYCYPLLLQFCILASGLYMSMLDSCIVKDSEPTMHRRDEQPDSSKADALIQPKSKDRECREERVKYENTSEGLFMGWLTVLLTLTVIMLCLYEAYTDSSHSGRYAVAVYSYNAGLSFACMVVVLCTAWQMTPMKTNTCKPSNQVRRARMFLWATFLTVACYKILSFIPGCIEAEWAIIADGILSLLSALAQFVFITKYASAKDLSSPEQRATKPGRQGLEFLRCINFCLWLVDALLFNTHSVRTPLLETYGVKAGVVISNIFQPLSALFYFHTMICFSNIIAYKYMWQGGKINNTDTKNDAPVPPMLTEQFEDVTEF